MNNDTPRTDARSKTLFQFSKLQPPPLFELVPSDIARELERELAEQVTLNGKGAEREADLRGRVERLERFLDEAKSEMIAVAKLFDLDDTVSGESLTDYVRRQLAAVTAERDELRNALVLARRFWHPDVCRPAEMEAAGIIAQALAKRGEL